MSEEAQFGPPDKLQPINELRTIFEKLTGIPGNTGGHCTQIDLGLQLAGRGPRAALALMTDVRSQPDCVIYVILRF